MNLNNYQNNSAEKEIFGGVILDENDGNDVDNSTNETESKRKKVEDKILQFQEKANESNRADDVSAYIDNNSQKTAEPEYDEFQNALIEYNNKNYTSAFNTFKKLAEEKNTEAAYILGNMYYKGLGTAVDSDRAKYWLKIAADKGHGEAAFDYALILLNNSSRVSKDITDGFYYLELSADNGYDNAAKKYIEIVRSGLGDKEQVKKAIQYCNMLANKCDDSYDSQSYIELAKNLKTTIGGGNTVAYKPSVGDVVYTILGILGTIMFAYGILFVDYAVLIDHDIDNTLTDIIQSTYNWLQGTGFPVGENMMAVIIPGVGATLISLANRNHFKSKIYNLARILLLVIIVLVILRMYLSIEPSAALQVGCYVAFMRVVGFIAGKLLGFFLDMI